MVLVLLLAHHQVLCCCSLAKPDSRTKSNSLVSREFCYGIVFTVANNVMAGISTRFSASSLRSSLAYLNPQSLLGLTTLVAAFLNPLNPIVHFWLHHTAHCAERIVSACLRAGSTSAKRVGQGEVGGVTGRVLCTWWLLGLAFKRPWSAPGGSPPTLTAWTCLENTTLTLQRASFWQERLLRLGMGVWQPIVLTLTCSLISGCGQSHETAWPEVDMGAVLESELGQKWRHGVLKACVG